MPVVIRTTVAAVLAVNLQSMRLVCISLCILTASQPLYADDADAGSTTSASSQAFDDAPSLEAAPPERILMRRAGGLLAGIRASSVVAYGDPQGSGPNIVGSLWLESSSSSFSPTRSLYWGLSEHSSWRAALGYGYELGGRYEVGGLLTTGKSGSGAFFRIGVAGELQALARLPFGKWWAYPALGYALQQGHARVELALLPSLGGMSVRPAAMDLTEPFWLRERLRAKLWHVQLELEHGRRGLDGAAAQYWQGTVCSSTGRIPLIACTGGALLGRTASQYGPRSEVSFAVGFGALHDKLASPHER